jgi:hypothetical protein
VLLEAGLIGRSKLKASAKGKGFTQPLRPHEHWHIDVSYLKNKEPGSRPYNQQLSDEKTDKRQ